VLVTGVCAQSEYRFGEEETSWKKRFENISDETKCGQKVNLWNMMLKKLVVV
jgi:uncharacterized protein YheU (UPF0270 family)